MCGLTGFSGKKNFEINKIKLLLLYNESRGKDSTGVYVPAMETILKDVKEATNWLSKNHFDEDNLLIGHTRAKTRGANTIKNAHPFNYGTIYGAHNGTLKNHIQLLQDNKLNITPFDVDSQVIFKLLDLHKDPRVLYDFEGAAAVLFTNSTENTVKSKTLYAFRNKERPLYMGKTAEGVYFSSLRNSLETIEAEEISLLETNVLYKFVDGEIKSRINIPREEKDEDIEEEPVNYNYYGNNNSYPTCDYSNQPKSVYTNSSVKAKYPIGCYVEPNGEHRSIKNNTVTKVKPGNLYCVKGYDEKNGFNRLVLEYEDGKEDWFSPYLFLDPLVIKPNTYGKTAINLKSNVTKKQIAPEGTIVWIIGINHEKGEVAFRLQGEEKVYEGPCRFVRALKKEETQASFDFQQHPTLPSIKDVPVNNQEQEEEEEEEQQQAPFFPSLAGKEVSGDLIEQFLDSYSEDMTMLHEHIKSCEDRNPKGYLTVEVRDSINKIINNLNTSMYEFVYEAGGFDSENDEEDEDNPAEIEGTKSKNTCEAPAD